MSSRGRRRVLLGGVAALFGGFAAVAEALSSPDDAGGGDASSGTSADGGAVATTSESGNASGPEDSSTSSNSSSSSSEGEEVYRVEVIPFRRATAWVSLTCSRFWIDVVPRDVEFFLVLQYRNAVTDWRTRFFAGPFTGVVEDPFGETDFDLVEALVVIPAEPTVAVYRPEDCASARVERLDASLGRGGPIRSVQSVRARRSGSDSGDWRRMEGNVLGAEPPLGR